MLDIVTGVLLAFMVCLLVLYYYQRPDLLVVESGLPGPVVLVVGGTHGNEPAGSVAAYELYDSLKTHGLKEGSVVIVPNANKWGLHVNLRFLPPELLSVGLLGKPDLNRSYACRGEEAKTSIARSIQQLVLEADWVIDLHEGYDFHKLNPESMGSGIYPGQTKLSHYIIPKLLKAVNATIPRESYQFISKDWPDENGTLRMFCDENNIHYTLVETSGQDNIQPIGIRVKQHLVIIEELLAQLKMI